MAPVTRGGQYTLAKMHEKTDYAWYREGMTEKNLNNVIARFKQYILAPARIAGEILLVHETLDQQKEHRQAWVYNPGQRRVRRAPNVAFDNAKNGGDGLATSDQLNMFNGSPERYDWKLIGKKELYVPYNAYQLQSPALKYADILKPLHMNPEHARYELHRVWVVEGTVKEDTRHIYQKRVFYVDEDSWSIVASDQYDNRDKLWRVSEGHTINFYEVPVLSYITEVHYDLQAGRYLAMKLHSEEPKSFDFAVKFAQDEFTTGTLRRQGKR